MVENQEKKECPACGSDKFEKVFSVKDHLVSNEVFEIRHCISCSLRITSPKPNVEEIGKYYKSDEYISHKEVGESVLNKIYKFVQRFSLIKKRNIIKRTFRNKKGTLLDVGCGTGDFLKVMNKAGWIISGVEKDGNARRIAQNTSGAPIFSIEQHFSDSNKYDVITMWHSLEHVDDLEKQIANLISLLNENGLLFVAVPNYLSFDAVYYMQNWAAYDAPRHLYHFSAQAMRTLFNKYDIDIIRYQQLPFDSFYISLLSEFSIIGSKNIVRAGWIGLRSYLNGLFNPKRASSVLYILERKS